LFASTHHVQFLNPKNSFVSSGSAQAAGSHENDMTSKVQFACLAEDGFGLSPQNPNRVPGCGKEFGGSRRWRSCKAIPESSVLLSAVIVTRVIRLDRVAGVHFLFRLKCFSSYSSDINFSCSASEFCCKESMAAAMMGRKHERESRRQDERCHSIARMTVVGSLSVLWVSVRQSCSHTTSKSVHLPARASLNVGVS